MLRGHPQLEPLLLNALAADASNERLVLSLWSGRGGETARGWQERLLNSLVAAGQYDRARAAWTKFQSCRAAAGRAGRSRFRGAERFHPSAGPCYRARQVSPSPRPEVAFTFSITAGTTSSLPVNCWC